MEAGVARREDVPARPRIVGSVADPDRRGGHVAQAGQTLAVDQRRHVGPEGRAEARVRAGDATRRGRRVGEPDSPDGASPGRTIAARRGQQPAQRGAEQRVGPAQPRARRRAQVAHRDAQQAPGQAPVPAPLPDPLARHLEQVPAGLGRWAREVAHLARDEVQREGPQLGQFADVVVVQPGFRDVADRLAEREVVGGEHPLREVPELGPQSAAALVRLAARDEAMVEHLAPGMEREALLDVLLVHVGLDVREPVVRDADGSAGERAPLGMVVEGLQAALEHVRLGPAVRLGEEQEPAAGSRGPGGAESDVVRRGRVLHPIVRSGLGRDLLALG